MSAATTPEEGPGSPKRKLLREDSNRRLKFKERSRELQKGRSSPALLSPKAPLPLSAKEVVSIGHGKGHEFEKKTFFQPTHCHHCTELLWGLRGQGLKCTVCNFIAHEKCLPNLKVSCRHIIAEKIQDPVSHQWTQPMPFHRKKWCNVCRKRIHSKGVICEVCKVYSHTQCRANAFNNCKKCATYNKGVKQEVRHHWIEGNLSSSARCEVCTKNCSTDCSLSGFRCGWCGMNVHSSCIDALELFEANMKECTYRDLWHMILVPGAVTHRMSVKSHLEQEREEETEEVFSPTTCHQDEVEEEDEEDEYGSKGRPVMVIDGSGQTDFQKWRSTTVHPTHIGKKMTAAELLSVSLRKCGISDPPNSYYLAELTDSAKTCKQERELVASECPYELKQTGYGLLKLYIRAKPQAEAVRGMLRINNDQLESPIAQVSCSVTTTMTATEIVGLALIKFDLLEEESKEYCLVEVSQVDGVRERVLEDSECPWKCLQDLRKQSVTFSNLQRYFLRHRQGGVTDIFLCKMDKTLLQDKEKYTEHVKKLIAEAPSQILPSEIPFDRIKIGPAFPNAGGLFLEFPTFDLAVRITAALEKSPNCPKIIMIPTVFPNVIGQNQEPLLVFVNGKSGGNQGIKLLSGFRRHLNPHQVYDVMNGGPLPGLYAFRHMSNFRVLIGGGDGTFGWALSALQEIREFLTCSIPPCGVLPLGTGNDLARALNWGGGYSGEKVMQILLAVEDANTVELDRWCVSWKEDPSLLPSNKASATPILSTTQSVVMNNYCGIGLDASIALNFHLAREENPEKFNSRFHNKGVYFQLGLQKMLTKSECSELKRHIRITVDGKRLDLPDVEGVVFLNIQSWGAGADAWGSSTDAVFAPPAMNDGMLEIVGISGAFHMGQVQSGIRSGIRLAQGKEIKLEVMTTLPFQVDGEAWPQPPGVVTMCCLPEQAIMLCGGDKQYSRQLSKKDLVKAMNLSKQLSETNLAGSPGGLASRRRVALSPGMRTPSDPTLKTVVEGESVDP